MRMGAAVALGLAIFVAGCFLLTAILVATTPPDLGAVGQIAGCVAIVVLPAAIALWLGRAVVRRGRHAGREVVEAGCGAAHTPAADRPR